MLDLPGIIEGASQGKGRGRQVIAVARTADMILMMLDAAQGEVQKRQLEKELEAVGIRLNRRRPNVYFKIKAGGGLSFNATVPLTHMNEKLAYHILHEYKIHNCEVLLREDVTMDEFIDVIVGNRKYLRCLYVRWSARMHHDGTFQLCTASRSRSSTLPLPLPLSSHSCFFLWNGLGVQQN